MLEPTPPKLATQHWRITNLVINLFLAVTRHHQLHQPEHVGMFAGSLLPRDQWDHR